MPVPPPYVGGYRVWLLCSKRPGNKPQRGDMFVENERLGQQANKLRRSGMFSWPIRPQTRAKFSMPSSAHTHATNSRRLLRSVPN
jgi:hypothetical protein